MKYSIRDYKYKGKFVLLRCDLNVPVENGIILDKTRVLESLKTINYLIDRNAKVIILSHFGRVKKEEDKKDNSLYPVYLELKKRLKTKVYFSEETRGELLEEKVNNLKNREILLIENTRYEDIDGNLESSCDKELSKYWANLADIFINDAYATCHRSHASNVGVAKLLPSGLGFLVEREVNKIDKFLEDDKRPYILVLGGKKVSDKTLLIESLAKECDKIILGGGMCFTFLKAKNINIGSSIVDDENIEFCKKILSKYENKIILPIDIINDKNQVVNINDLSNNDIGYDIGPKTIKLFLKELTNAKRVILNGPMGVYENTFYSKGTKKVFNYLANSKAKVLICGGDTISALHNLKIKNNFYHISTGGGASLEYIAKRKLPGIDIIKDKEEK